MLVSPTLFKVLLYGALGVAGACVVVLTVLRQQRQARRAAAAALPTAEVRAGYGRTARRGTWPRLATIVALLGALGTAWWLHWYSLDVVLVTDGDSMPLAVRYVHLGKHDPYSARHDWTPCRHAVWIENESSTALQLIRVGYGPMGSSTESIAPHEFVCARTLDYIGPWDLPASSVMVSGKEGEVAPTMDSRYWLTW